MRYAFLRRERYSSVTARPPVVQTRPAIQMPPRIDDPPGPAHAPARKAQRVAVGVLALLLAVLGLYTVRRFLGALVWAGIIAIALWPLYTRAAARFGRGRRNVLLPAAFTLGAALVFVVPLLLIGTQLTREIHTAAEWLRSVQQNGIPEPDIVQRLPFGRGQIDGWWKANLADPDDAKALAERFTHGRVGDLGRELGEQLARRVTLFGFTLLTLFFLLKDGASVTRQMQRAGERTFGVRGERVGLQIIASVHGTVNGLVLVGLGEGFVIGIVYVLAGLPHATIFGVLTAVAAMVPFGAPFVIGAAALLLIAQGAMVWGIAVFCIGLAVTFIADHFIRPELIGGAIRLPFIWVLLGILGGLEAWGLLGLFLGPAIMASLILLWREWAGEVRQPG
jgi:predicted PurR-regulated permease PerM